jgi:hypothetical protein
VAAASWLLCFGCAVGFPQPDEVSAPLMSEPNTAGNSADGGVAGAAEPAAGSGGQPFVMFMGDPCVRGTMEACTCTDGVSAGQRSCMADSASPTGGAFGECTRCVMPTPPPGGGSGGSAAGSGGSAAGGGGTSGGGASGSSGSGSSAGSSGGSGSGAAGTGAGGSGSAAGCDPDDCDEPLFGSACCTRDDECGVRLLLSCNAR